jgi:hypothetical protein
MAPLMTAHKSRPVTAGVEWWVGGRGVAPQNKL